MFYWLSLSILSILSILLPDPEPCEVIRSIHGNGQPEVIWYYPNCEDQYSYFKRTYFKSGQIQGEAFYSPERNYVEIKSWYENGQMEAHWQLKNEKEHGEIHCWYENGQKKRILNLNEGVMEGPFIQWRENGTLEMQGNFKEDKKDGIWIFWYESGQMKMTETYEEGIYHGRTTIWFPNGQLDRKIDYSNGKEDGEFLIWDSTGLLLFHYQYENGEVADSFPTSSNPFNNLDYDRVVAYEFDGTGARFIKDVLQSMPERIEQEKALTPAQIEHFEEIITARGAYGQATAACFDPHLAVIYYKGEEMVALVDVCLQCNSLRSTQEIPAESEFKMDEGTEFERALFGFSKTTRKKLDEFLEEIGFDKYREDGESVFE